MDPAPPAVVAALAARGAGPGCSVPCVYINACWELLFCIVLWFLSVHGPFFVVHVSWSRPLLRARSGLWLCFLFAHLSSPIFSKTFNSVARSQCQSLL